MGVTTMVVAPAAPAAPQRWWTDPEAGVAGVLWGLASSKQSKMHWLKDDASTTRGEPASARCKKGTFKLGVRQMGLSSAKANPSEWCPKCDKMLREAYPDDPFFAVAEVESVELDAVDAEVDVAERRLDAIDADVAGAD